MLNTSYLFETKQTERARVGIFIIKENKIIVGDATPQSNPYKYKYIIPGGGIEPGESLKQTCIRESMEEISIVPKNIKILINKPYIKCGLKSYGFKYDCSKLYYCYGQYSHRDKSIWGTEDGFKTPPIELEYTEIKDWLKWCINVTKNDIPRNFKYKADLEMLEKLVKINIIS